MHPLEGDLRDTFVRQCNRAIERWRSPDDGQHAAAGGDELVALTRRRGVKDLYAGNARRR